MNGSAASSPRPIASLRRLADGVFTAAREGVDLVSLELWAERIRLVRAALWVCAAAFAAMMSLACFSMALVFLWGGAARVPVLAGLGAVYACALGVAWIGARRQFAPPARQPGEARASRAQNGSRLRWARVILDAFELFLGD